MSDKALGFALIGSLITIAAVAHWIYKPWTNAAEKKIDTITTDSGWPRQAEELKDVAWNASARLITFTDAHGQPCTLVVIAGYAPALSCGETKPPAPYITERGDTDHSILRPAL